MSFLAPLFLLGALAVAGPVMFHLIRRTTRDRVPFSSLMFLQPTAPRLTKRSRIEHWLLLLLRALALGLLALAFARPFWKSPAVPPPDSATGGRTAVLLDVSASLRRDGLWPAAQETARAAIRDAAATQAIALIAFDRATRTVMSFDDWRSMDAASRMTEVVARIDELQPTWQGTDLAVALSAAAEALVDGDTEFAGAPRRLVLVSDLQEGGRLEALQSYDWPKGVEVILAPVAPSHPGNAGLQLAAGKTEKDAPAAGVRLRVSNATDSTGETFQVGWSDAAGDAFAGTAVDVYVPPGQSRLVTVPWPTGQPAPGRLRLAGDSERFDNTVTTAPPPQTRIHMVHLGLAAADDPRQPEFFLQKAVPQTPRLTTEITTVPATTGPLPAGNATQAEFIVITQPVDPAMAAAVRAHMDAGTTALIVLNGPAMAGTLSVLAGGGSISLEETTPPTYAMLGEIDFRHPVFAPFADPRFSDFTKIRFQHYRKLDPVSIVGARVPARFDSGDPALLESDVGRGRLVVLTSGWVPADSQLAVSSKFAPLLASLLEWSGASAMAPASFVVGDPIPRLALGAPVGLAVSIRTPMDVTSTMPADAPAFTETTEPGLYQAATGAAPRLLPVNLDPAESRTAPLTADEFERWGVPIARVAQRARDQAAREAPAPATEAENRQKLWRWFLVAALAVLLLETILAGRAARRALIPAEVTP